MVKIKIIFMIMTMMIMTKRIRTPVKITMMSKRLIKSRSNSKKHSV